MSKMQSTFGGLGTKYNKNPHIPSTTSGNKTLTHGLAGTMFMKKHGTTEEPNINN